MQLYANARYVRMYGYTRVESGSGFSIKEMKVYKYKAGDSKRKLHSIPKPCQNRMLASNGKRNIPCKFNVQRKSKTYLYTKQMHVKVTDGK
ncbi:MAG: hypothetical protein ACLRR3_07405 [Eubacterium sp.]